MEVNKQTQKVKASHQLTHHKVRRIHV